MSVVRIQNKELLNDLARLADSSVAVGFFPQDTYLDGKQIAEVASIHEFGAVINQTGSKAGPYQIRIPCRSFMRTTIHEQEQNWIQSCANLVRSGMPIHDVMGKMGAKIGSDIQMKIKAIFAAEHRLIDTGNMLRSVSFLVKDGTVTKAGSA